MSKNLVIVESPAKARTIEKILGKDFSVKSCNGHIRDLSKKDISIDIKNDFKPKYELLPEKKALLNELQKSTKEAEKVWLATDEDREGEAISWHLLEALNIDESKTERITFHEITKDAILNSIKNPRKINRELVDAQQARRVLDRIVGYELSPLLWKKVRPGLSAGRVQSVAVKLIVEREDEIRQFSSEFTYRISAIFNIQDKQNNKTIEAELSFRFPDKQQAKKFLELCKDAEFKILDVEKKPSFKSPAPPFTTSSLQQEASRKLGFPVAKTMVIAQQLYETGKITYMRTDSVNLSDLAIASAKKEIETLFGKEYSQVRKFSNKIKGAQEAHEAIRPTYMNSNEIDGTKDQKNLYELIWKRTIASQMSNANIEKTIITISSPEKKYHFIARGEVVLFDGFLKVYKESEDEDEQQEGSNVLPQVNIDDILNYKTIIATQKFSQPPYRYAEASLVKKLEELGIGRPSTYAPIISTIQKREYVVKETRKGSVRQYDYLTLSENKITEEILSETFGAEKNKLFPTDLGSIVTGFLNENFSSIVNYQFTATVEKQFDEIASGDIQWTEMIRKFYADFHPKIEQTATDSKKFIGERLLGKDPETGMNVYAKVGRYGPLIQIGETGGEPKPKFASLLKHQSIQDISLEDAMKLFSFPIILGKHTNEEVIVSVGPYGPYVKFEKKFYQIPAQVNPLEVTLSQALEIIETRKKGTENTIINNFDNDPDLSIRKGKWGMYLKFKNENFKLPKGHDPEAMSKEDCMKIIEDAKLNPPKKKSFKKK
jgi:DNA topoisomerase I